MRRKLLDPLLLTVAVCSLLLSWLVVSAQAEETASDRPEANPETLSAVKFLRERRKEKQDLPRRGELAPDFHLKLIEGSELPGHVAPDDKGRIRLSDYAGKKPVVLIFGSYT